MVWLGRYIAFTVFLSLVEVKDQMRQLYFSGREESFGGNVIRNCSFSVGEYMPYDWSC